ncbi:hypothetical protein [Paraflavitalea pollutisoli]|uniref:hypothetical protein n=1 Tax=Paraflavitalea pollutisoli TaxID=3034143 RepID=UPI0023ED05A6|nr:hypothetical protein [Paraflavitalea sp. H1-2-19X]
MKYLLIIALLACSVTVHAQSHKHLYTQAENERLLRLLDSTHQALLSIVSRLSEQQFSHHVDIVSWSANDIVEHLGLIDEGYIRELWFTLAQPVFPDSYADSTKGGDEKAMAYATQPEKGRARGTNLPRNRYCDKQTCVRIFTEANELAKQFYIANASKDLRRQYVFRIDSKGVRSIKDAHQLGLLLVAHRMRHIDQLKRIIADPRFAKAD